MDTTEQNIKMCAKAVEIQGLWVPEEGDFILNTSATPLSPSKRFIYVNYLQQPFCNSPHWELITTTKRSFLTWLPRLDQLWQLCIDHDGDRYYDFIEFANCSPEEYQLCFKKLITHYPTSQWTQGEYLSAGSREQLLLKYLYKVCYNKTWNGEDWEAR